MGTLILKYTNDFDQEIEVASVKGEDLLECLAAVHEQLNAVAMPRKYQDNSLGTPMIPRLNFVEKNNPSPGYESADLSNFAAGVQKGDENKPKDSLERTIAWYGKEMVLNALPHYKSTADPSWIPLTRKDYEDLKKAGAWVVVSC